MRWPFRPKHVLYPWDVEYFQHLIAELNTLDAPASDPRIMRAQKLIEIFRNDRDKVNRSDLLELEQTLLSLQSTETLLQRAPVLRLRYREVVGEAQYSVYQPPDISKLCQADDSVRKVLLPDLKNLVSGIHWRYILQPLIDKVQRELTQFALWWILGYTAVWVGAVVIAGHWAKMPFLAMLATVVYAGIIGGYISAMRRVQSVPADADSLLNIQALKSGYYFLYLSPLLGAIFSIVLLLIFMAGLVSGTMFPSFGGLDCKDCKFPSNMGAWPLWTQLRPSTGADYAKLFLWSFISGFAERFVPDILDRVIQRGQSASAVKASTGNGNKPLPLAPPSKDDEPPAGDATEDAGKAADQPAAAAEAPPVKENGGA